VLALSAAEHFYSSAVVFGPAGKVFFWELVTLIDIMLLAHPGPPQPRGAVAHLHRAHRTRRGTPSPVRIVRGIGRTARARPL
jgi:hypothetical protein